MHFILLTIRKNNHFYCDLPLSNSQAASMTARRDHTALSSILPLQASPPRPELSEAQHAVQVFRGSSENQRGRALNDFDGGRGQAPSHSHGTAGEATARHGGLPSESTLLLQAALSPVPCRCIGEASMWTPAWVTQMGRLAPDVGLARLTITAIWRVNH